MNVLCEKKDKKNAQKQKANFNESKKLRFNNFTEREYDYDLLEKRLLGWSED